MFELLVGAGVHFLKHKQFEALQTSAVPERHEAYIIGWQTVTVYNILFMPGQLF